MKKILIPIAIIMSILVMNIKEKEDTYILPKETIRLRIIASSNTPYDQFIKINVKENMEKVLENTISEDDDIETFRKTINENLYKFENEVQETIDSYKYNKPFNIKYGYNYFPEKEYKGVKYEEGMYESLVVSLGEAKGDNWWCVLFPPLCMLEVEESEKDDIEYRFLVKDIVDKYIK